ncbi:hypothetical protein MRS76_18560 [Rhizobiaceae bacterium n13]|uniref:Uncharacterized protein n=1 Tax=Ferirhizobium litorale TaxID=2927786 RepID=A0AAE3QFR1_9HYPH|nr:hypothetical protein [Fererhizobium litorale]MDI7863956.1 hypothetical protein [Fererhizobium litorale]MDI7924211.1 hypothetical protein [Fererhizobium litorale]
MSDGNAMGRLAERGPVLVEIALLMGIVPHALMVLGIRGFTIGLIFFLLNLALCAMGLAAGMFRVFWLCWGLASVAFFILFGMTTPIGMVLVLPRLTSHWL